jgi:hypothetical protein
MDKTRTCKTCFYGKGADCAVLTQKIEHNCFAWADEVEAKKRAAACKKYKDEFSGDIHYTLSDAVIQDRSIINKENRIKRGGKSVKEVLDVGFMKLYKKGLNDDEIGKKLTVGKCYVGEYRRNLGLETNKKDRPEYRRKYKKIN